MTATATNIQTEKRRRRVYTAVLTAERPAASKPQEGEMSVPEKDILCSIVHESEPLPYPLRPLEMAFGPDEQAYDIPEEDKAGVLRQAWPFAECPGMDDELYDLHECRHFRFREAMVVRCRNRNLMVSPYYAKSGGMAVDFVSRLSEADGREPCVRLVRK